MNKDRIHKRITIPLKDGAMRRMRATETAAPGLVVTHTLPIELEEGWHVTHEESGYVLGDAWETRAQALAFAEALSKLPINWTLPRLQLLEQLYFWREDYKPVIKEMREAVHKK